METDVLVIGGGIQGAGVAQAASAAGYRVMLVEKTAIAAGTSSKSSKLIHGGLRYLESGQFALVRKSILERERLIQLARDLIHPVPFYIPIYKHTQRHAWQIRIGLLLYSLLGNFRSHARFSSTRINPITGLTSDKLKKVFRYYDAQTDDAGLTRAVVNSAVELGTKILCPAELVNVGKQGDDFIAEINDKNDIYKIKCHTIVNATGPWANRVISKISDIELNTMDYDCVQGTHIELDVPAPEGVLYVEAPQDGRAVFIMPWHGNTLVGTTEKLYEGDIENVHATDEEVSYLEKVFRFYFPQTRYNIINSFAGLRVLPKSGDDMFNRPRDTEIFEAAPGFVTLYGGKLTSYRATARQVINVIRQWLPEREPIADTRSILLKSC